MEEENPKFFRKFNKKWIKMGIAILKANIIKVARVSHSSAILWAVQKPKFLNIREKFRTVKVANNNHILYGNYHGKLLQLTNDDSKTLKVYHKFLAFFASQHWLKWNSTLLLSILKYFFLILQNSDRFKSW